MKNLTIHISQTRIRAMLQGLEENPFSGIAKYIEVPLGASVVESDNIIRYQAFLQAIKKLIDQIKDTDYTANIQNARISVDCSLRFDIHSDRVTQQKEEHQDETIQANTPELLNNKFIDLEYLDQAFQSIAHSIIEYSVYRRGMVQPIITLQNKEDDPSQLEGTRGSRIDAVANVIQVNSEYLDSITRALTENDIMPLSIEPSCISILRLFEKQIESSTSMTLYIGEKISQIMISENFRVFAISSLDFGIDTLVQSISKKLHTKAENIQMGLFSTESHLHSNRSIIKGGVEIDYKEIEGQILLETGEILKKEIEPFLAKYLSSQRANPLSHAELQNFNYICHQESSILHRALNTITKIFENAFNINLKLNPLYDSVPKDFKREMEGEKNRFIYATLGCNRVNLYPSIYLFHRDYAGLFIRETSSSGNAPFKGKDDTPIYQNKSNGEQELEKEIKNGQSGGVLENMIQGVKKITKPIKNIWTIPVYEEDEI